MKDKIAEIIIWSFIVIFCVGFASLSIYIWVKYGNEPIDEVPMWALWFLFPRR